MVCRIAVLLTLAARAWADSCSGEPTSVKQMWQDAPFVFVGTVELADPDLPEYQAEFQLIRIRVDEAFKGVAKGQVIELHEDLGEFNARFRTGERHVFYLYMGDDPKEFVVPICTHALGNAQPGSDDLLFLRGLPKSAIGTRLSGAVELLEQPAHDFLHHVRGVPDVTVWITTPGQPPHQTVTNSAGAWEVYGLAPGDYSVHIDVPSGFTPFGDPDSMAKLEAEGAASIDFDLMADTRLYGRVLDAEGAPRPDVCFDLEPVESPGRSRLLGCPDESGNFEITQMPSGQYRLVAHDEVGTPSAKSQSTLYYPGVRDLNQAGVVTVEVGKYVEGVEIRTPANEARDKLGGKLQYSDGVPVPQASVTFTSPERGYSETTKTEADGSFHLSVLAGTSGQLRARMQVPDSELSQCPQFPADGEQIGDIRLLDSESVSLSPESDQDRLLLEMPFRSCVLYPLRPD